MVGSRGDSKQQLSGRESCRVRPEGGPSPWQQPWASPQALKQALQPAAASKDPLKQPEPRLSCRKYSSLTLEDRFSGQISEQ